jgi:DNA-directed RNA polymerase specialized sigma24 family protein
MKNNYSIAERNRIVEENLPMIDKVIRHNWALMKAAHLDYDDVYQDLAIRLIRCVENFDSDKGTLRAHIYSQLKYELLNCKTPLKRTGITGLPYNSRWNDILSLDTISEGNCAFAVA